MKPGDLVFFKKNPRSLISRLISFLTKSEYTHVGLAIGDSTIIDIDRFGISEVREIDFDNEVHSLYRPYGITKDQQESILAYAMILKDDPKRYDYFQIFLLILRLVFGFNWLSFNRTNKLICSELVDYAYFFAGIPRNNLRKLGDITPSELFQVYELRKIMDFRKV